MSVEIRPATVADAAAVAALVHRLLGELHGRAPPAEPGRYAEACRRLLTEADTFAALLGLDHGRPVATLTLATCASVYALGRFGVIAEFYVEPERRSAGVGRALLAAAAAHGRARGWSRLEVGAPDVPRWARTVAFYRANGFAEIGPRLQLRL